MKASFYKIEALTNMHVGSGDANYGIIDNLIQRDAVTTLPTINGSSLKGALREFFVNKWGEKDDKLIHIFGSNDNNAAYRFLSANLLAIPVRSNKKAWFLATAPMAIKNLKNELESFGGKLDISAFDDVLKETEGTPTVAKGTPVIFLNETETSGLMVEDFRNFNRITKPVSQTIFGNWENLIILNDEDFLNLCSDDNLPVIARNKVGENLWYEQVVPHKSLFSFVLLHNDNYKINFDEGLEKEIIHIGANATVGNGFTKISKIV